MPVTKPVESFESEFFPREDKQAHRTPIRGQVRCRFCRLVIPVRRDGRQREFCTPACRVAWHRAHKRAS